ncbi:hypothetical protein BX666DRAFT_1986239 [Dichotomocladium elegans]|nr:hypothetical protein BX666DRAFT_1986239 [Dichotomocladium elegans]
MWRRHCQGSPEIFSVFFFSPSPQTLTRLFLVSTKLMPFFSFSREPKRNSTFLAFGKYVWLDRDYSSSNNSSTNQSLQTFGKGSLSRSHPTWLERTRALASQSGETFLEHLTVGRRRQRRGLEEDVAGVVKAATALLTMADNRDFEEMRLDLYEAFYLLYALNAIVIRDPQQNILSIDKCWQLFSDCIPSFGVHYGVYHHYRSRGWVPKQGTKFGVDYVLYRPGPRHSHADFAVKIVPVGKDEDDNRPLSEMGWTEIQRISRVCAQVRKTLILCHVKVNGTLECPPQSRQPGIEIQEVIIKRWSPERNRERSVIC